MLNIDIRGIDALAGLGDTVAAATQAGLKAVANDTRTHVASEIAKTYGRPIPTKAEYAKGSKKARLKANGAKRVGKKQLASVGNGAKAGEPAWKRSGALAAGVRMDVGEDAARIHITGEAAKAITNYEGGYAERLASIPTGPDGVNRSNPFIETAAERMEPKVQAIFEQEIRNHLGS